MIAATQSDGFVRSGKMESPPPVRGRVGAFRGSPDIRCGTGVLAHVFALKNLLNLLLNLCLSADCQAKSSEHIITLSETSFCLFQIQI